MPKLIVFVPSSTEGVSSILASYAQVRLYKDAMVMTWPRRSREVRAAENDTPEWPRFSLDFRILKSRWRHL